MSYFSSFVDDLKSGKSLIYASWFARIALIGMIIIPIFLIVKMPHYCALVWISSAFVLCLEFPFFRHCFRAGSAGERFILGSQLPIYRCILYAIFSTIMWLSIIFDAFTLLILPAIILSISSILFLVALIRREEPDLIINSTSSTMTSMNAGGMAWSTTTNSRSAEIGKV